MPIARYWVVKTGGNEVTEEMASTWRNKFLTYAIENGCMRGALAADDERVIAVSDLARFGDDECSNRE